VNKVVIINLSPRTNGTSKMLANMCKDFLSTKGQTVNIVNLYSHLNHIDTVLNLIREADTIIMSGPCYVDHFPADTIYLLEQISTHSEILHNQSVYGMIQGGMPYIHTHESGVKTLELFCEDNNIIYKGSFVIGLGAMLNGQPLDELPNGKKVKRNYLVFLEHVAKGEFSPDSLYKEAQFILPHFVWKLMTKRMNYMINKNLSKKGIDYKQPSPYWKM
jgi:hypothetical protein